MNSVLDDALERLRGTGPEMVGEGGPNHGPMAAEALVTLDCADEVAAWVDRYRRELGPMPEARSPVTEGEWRAALGVTGRIGDWQAFFRAQLADAPWQRVFAKWIPRLIPAAMAAGTHGLIRTAHAVRALAEAETPLRVEEFGTALAYWAAYHHRLPGVPHLNGPLDLAQAIAQIPRIGRRRERLGTRREGVPREFVRVLEGYDEFSGAVNALAAPGRVETSLSALTEMGARLYLANASAHPLIFIHAVTGPAALRILLAHMPGEMHGVALAYGWQAFAAWVAAYGGETLIAPDPATPPGEPEIVERAVDTGDHHAIKFVEACIREHRLTRQPVYLTAALDWPNRLLASRQWSAAQRAAAGIAIGWDPIERRAMVPGRR
jgi:Questin oxidase-like